MQDVTLVMACPKAALGVEPVLGVTSIKHFRAIHPGLKHLGVHAERIAGKHHEIRILARFQGADTVFQAEHLGPCHREPVQRTRPRHSGPHRQRSHPVEQS